MDSLIIPQKNLTELVTALLKCGYWIRTEEIFDEKVLVFIRKDEK